MKTISVVCEKGGVGKTVIAKELYEAAIRRGHRASLYALDGQYRNRSVKDSDPEIVVIDTAGQLNDNLKEIINDSDVVVVPTRPTPNDLEPFTQTVDIVRSVTDVPILIAVNGFNHYKMASVFMSWLNDWIETTGFKTDILTIPQSEQIVQAQPGQSAVDLGKKTNAAKALETMADKVFELAEIN